MTAEPIEKRPTRRRFTVDEYYRLAETGILTSEDRVELLDGEIIEMVPIGSQHAAHVKRLNSLISRALGDAVIVAVQDPIRLDRFSEPEPDIAVLHPRDDFYASAHPGPDDVFLVIEVADSSFEFDRTRKIPLYAEHGVPCVWLLNLQDDTIETFEQPESGEYQRVRTLSGDDEVGLESVELAFAASELFV